MKIAAYALVISLPLMAAPPVADNDDIHETNTKKSAKVSGQASSSAVGVSMMLWGLGIAAVITVLSLTVGGSSSHSH